MRRYPPFDQQSVPDAPWVNGDPDLGLEGSIIDARAIDHSQSEIINAIIAAGLTPSESVLDQLSQAIPILAALGGSDAIIDTEITKTVGTNASDFMTLNDAFTWVLRRRIIAPGLIKFVHAPGKYNYQTDINFYHPDGDRIQVIAAPLASTLPPPSALAYTGTTAQARANDTATSLAALRVAYGTEIFLQGAHRLRVFGNLGLIEGFLISADGTGYQQDAVYFEAGHQSLRNVSIVGAQSSCLHSVASIVDIFGYCHMVGAGLHGAYADSGALLRLNLGAILSGQSCANQGIQAVYGSAIYPVDSTSIGPPMYARGNAGNGIDCSASVIVCTPTTQSLNNALYGFVSINPGKIRAQGCVASGNQIGFFTNFGGQIDCPDTSGANSLYGYRADNLSQIYRINGTATGGIANASPSPGSTGNNNSQMI